MSFIDKIVDLVFPSKKEETNTKIVLIKNKVEKEEKKLLLEKLNKQTILKKYDQKQYKLELIMSDISDKKNSGENENKMPKINLNGLKSSFFLFNEKLYNLLKTFFEKTDPNLKNNKKRFSELCHKLNDLNTEKRPYNVYYNEEIINSAQSVVKLRLFLKAFYNLFSTKVEATTFNKTYLFQKNILLNIIFILIFSPLVLCQEENTIEEDFIGNNFSSYSQFYIIILFLIIFVIHRFTKKSFDFDLNLSISALVIVNFLFFCLETLFKSSYILKEYGYKKVHIISFGFNITTIIILTIFTFLFVLKILKQKTIENDIQTHIRNQNKNHNELISSLNELIKIIKIIEKDKKYLARKK
jgi:hypothetical protein